MEKQSPVSAIALVPSAGADSALPARPPQDRSLPLDWLLSRAARQAQLLPEVPAGADESVATSDRILARLIQLEAHERDIWEQENYRQAFITLCLALKGDPEPFVAASYRMYGLHPEKLWPAILARRAALLGSEATRIPSWPKKPIASVSADVQQKRQVR